MSVATQTEKGLDSAGLKQRLPEGPGVYIFQDGSGKILYVGKAKNIKKRVLSYLKPAKNLSTKTAHMVSKARRVDYFLTATENEAFILESNLIKRHMPRYNIILRDDKQYPCLRLSIKDRYPRLRIVRKIQHDGALYFGPFSSANAVRRTLRLVEGVFQLRKCKTDGLPKRSRPCLNHQLGKCLGPCTRDISPARYREIVEQVRLFLEGRNRELITRLEKDMSAASQALNFERAAQIRDQIRAVERTIERQNVVSPKMEDRDIIGVTRDEKRFQLVVLFVRKGYLLGSRGFRFRDGKANSSEIVEAFLKQYYNRERFIPKQILISEEVEDIRAITDFLSTLAGKKVSVHHPKKGEKKRLTDMAVTNAGNLLRARVGEDGSDLMEKVRVGLNLVATPRVIEGLDISNIQGDLSVGTVVSFVNGLPNKAGYRNYKIRQVAGADDYAMMSQLASRRIAKGALPDLFVVDGGKGHLMVVQRELAALRNGQTPDLVALAKRDERRGEKTDKVYLPGRKNPVQLKEGHPVLFLLMRIRDEAHRRAIAYHRRLRSKKLKESVLDGIRGVGPARKRRLLEHFGDVSRIARADFEALSGVPGISRETAAEILTFFKDI